MRQLNPNGAFQEVMVKGHLNSFSDVPLEIEQETDEVDKSTTENLDHSIFSPMMQQAFLTYEEAQNGNIQFEGSTSYQDQISLLKKEILEKNQQISEKNQQISEMKGLLSEKDEEILELRSKLSNPTFQQ